MQRAAPVAVETGTIYFGAFTGAQTILRDAQAGMCSRYIFNVRASYAQEAYATMELFKKKGVVNYKNLISFDQNDSFGQAGYDGLVEAYRSVIGEFPGNADPNNPIVRFRYTRNDDTSVPAQAPERLETKPRHASRSSPPSAAGQGSRRRRRHFVQF